MSDRKYYVICENNCKFESMTKEQIYTAIEQAVTTGTITNVDTGFVSRIKEKNKGAKLAFWVGSNAEYNALTEKDNNCFYILTDDPTAETLANIEAAVTENTTAIGENTTAIATLETTVNGNTNSINTINTDMRRLETSVAQHDIKINRCFESVFDGSLTLGNSFTGELEQEGIYKLYLEMVYNGVATCTITTVQGVLRNVDQDESYIRFAGQATVSPYSGTSVKFVYTCALKTVDDTTTFTVADCACTETTDGEEYAEQAGTITIKKIIKIC